MTENELDQIRKHWQVKAAQLGRILCVHMNKISEYLSRVTRLPSTVEIHTEVLQSLPDDTRVMLIEQLRNSKHTVSLN